MKIAKSVTVSLSACIALTAFAGCTKEEEKKDSAASPASSASPTAAATTAPKKDPVKLVMWGGVPPENGPQEAVDNWNKQHPEIQVSYERFVNDDAGNLKLDTMMASGQQVDLYMSYAFDLYEKRIKAGTALDLSTFKDYSVDDKMGIGATTWKVDGKYYGVPTNKGLSFVWLNKDMLDAKGLQVPTDWTIDEMREYAKKLKVDKGWGLAQTDYYFTVPITGSLLKASPKLVKADGTSGFDSPAVPKTLQTYYDMMFTDKSLMPHSEQLTSKPAIDQMFVKGQTAMLFSTQQVFRTTNNVKDYPRTFKVAAAPAPKVFKDQADYINAGGLGDVLSINAKSKYKEEAWQFVKWYADEGMLPLARGGRIPASKDFNKDNVAKLMFEGVENTYDLESVKRVMFGNLPLGLGQLDKKTGEDQKAVYDKYYSQKIASAEEAAKQLTQAHNENLKASK
ncbi:ABC transporter substrate-binding protein [Gorillibacterium sp. sgz5001074]|uniref:ABC transporter substrate-binding protein n=1 Tax=Gorillibacterium sp. sgz5001074 TaxID=3446695 RepID=UPI003F66E9EF